MTSDESSATAPKKPVIRALFVDDRNDLIDDW